MNIPAVIRIGILKAMKGLTVVSALSQHIIWQMITSVLVEPVNSITKVQKQNEYQLNYPRKCREIKNSRT
jgi:hypothetical protein